MTEAIRRRGSVGRQSAQELWRHRRGRRRLIRDRKGKRARAARRERRRQIHDRQASLRTDPAGRWRHQVFGQPARLRSPRVAHALGVQTAFQEMTLVPDLTVLDNMLLPYAPMGPVGTDPPADGRCGAARTFRLAGLRRRPRRRDRRPRSRRAAEDRDRPRRLPQAAL